MRPSRGPLPCPPAAEKVPFSIMKKTVAPLLLELSLVPSWVAGLPLYECRITGEQGFASRCCSRTGAVPVEETMSCCGGGAETEVPLREAPAGARVGCSCCEVSFMQLVTLAPGGGAEQELELAMLARDSELSSAPSVTFASPRKIRSSLSLPPEDPLPLRHGALRV